MTTDYKVITGKVRLSFTKNVFTPDEKNSYSIMVLIDKTGGLVSSVMIGSHPQQQ